MMWRIYLPKHCRDSNTICANCVKAAIDKTYEDITRQIDQFRADAHLGCDDTVEQKLINEYAKGNVEGYNNAVNHIRTMLIDMRECMSQ